MLPQITYTLAIVVPFLHTYQAQLPKLLEMAMMMEVEDDVFFADLNRQISLLITDDEDGHDVYYSPPISSYPSYHPLQDFSRTSVYPTTQPQYHFDQISYKTLTTDQSKGTGVFIPKSSQWNRSRRSKQQPTRSNNTNYNTYNTANNFKHYAHQLPSQTVFSQGIIGSKKC